ncbi:MAG: ABC transporter permease [Bryobacteraceae bacterium]
MLYGMRFGLRSLRRHPWFAATAVLTVALGIGLNTAVFGIVYSVLLRPLPFRDPSRLVEIWQTHPALPQLQVTVPDYEDFRAQSRSFESIAAYTLSAMNHGTLFGQGAPESVHATMVSPNLFAAMGIQPLAGRAFTSAEDHARDHVALLSESLWRHKFAADAAVIGRQIRIDSQTFRVVGILPRRQAFPAWADLWIPLSLIEPELTTRRKYHPLELMARLKPGFTPAQAQSEIQALARRASAAHPDTNATVGAFVVPLAEQTTRAVRPSLLLTWAAVGLVLLMASANLVHLFLARLAERRQEILIRRALGAGAWQLARAMITECAMVAGMGGAVGVLGILAVSGGIPRFAMTPPVWLFSIAITMAAAVLFAVPAVWSLWRAPLAAGSRVTRSRTSGALIGAEVAMALLVIAGAALLTRSLAAILDEDPGVRARQVWVAPNIPLQRSFDTAPAFVSNRLLPAVRALSGVEAAAIVNVAPLGLAISEHSRFATRFGIEGRTFEAGSYPVAQHRWVSPGYFAALGVPLRAGRKLAESDAAAGRTLINETLARRFFPNQDPIGRHLVLGVMDTERSQLEIAGVVGDVRDFGLDRETEPTFYTLGAGPTVTLVVKAASLDPSRLRAAVQSVDPDIPVEHVHPLQQDLDESLSKRRMILALFSLFGAIAAFLTAAGIYALMAQSVAARMREFGVRAAVGATPGALVRMILVESLRLTAPGVILGTLLALSFARLMKTFVYRVAPADPISIGLAAACLIAVAALSGWLPARRAAAVDPASALKAE